MRKSFLILAMFAVALFGGLVMFPARPAQAIPPLTMAQYAAMVGPAFIDSYKVTCATSATSIAPASGQALAIECHAPESADSGGTTIVGIGDSGIADPAFATRNSPVMCGSGCAKTSLTANAKTAFCRADSGTVDVFCWALVSQTP